MPILPQGLNHFKMSEMQTSSLGAEFNLLIPQCTLSRSSDVDRVINNFKKVSGIYFWVMQHSNMLFRIYVGKTNSMSSRLQNYVGEFQPHSPNDYKLRIFYGFLSDIAPSATLNLYFSARSGSQLTEAENLAIRYYDPLLNRRLQSSVAARAAFRDAFASYYRSAFERFLQKPADNTLTHTAAERSPQ